MTEPETKLEIGDEVEFATNKCGAKSLIGKKAIVIAIADGWYKILFADGQVFGADRDDVKKTGKCHPEFIDILRKLRGVKNEYMYCRQPNLRTNSLCVC